jgi:hypothetical protein
MIITPSIEFFVICIAVNAEVVFVVGCLNADLFSVFVYVYLYRIELLK